MSALGRFPLVLRGLFVLILLLMNSALIGGVNVWTAIGPPQGPEAISLAVDPGMTSVFYAPPWRTVDGGGTWELTSLSDYLNDHVFVAVAAGPSGTVYASASCCTPDMLSPGILLKSVDSALSWIQVLTLPRCEVQQILIDPMVPSTVFGLKRCEPTQPYHPLGSSELIKSLNGGRTWMEIGQGLTGLEQGVFLSELAMDPTDHEILYVSTPTGLFKSADGGSTWSLLNPKPVSSLVIDPSNPLAMYGMHAISSSDLPVVSRSLDGGRTFFPANRGLGFGGSQRVTLTINPKHPESLYAAANGDKYDLLGLFDTDSAGACWKPMNVGDEALHETFTTINEFAIDPAGNFLLAVTNINNGQIFEFEFAPDFEPVCPSLPRPEPRVVSPRH